MNDDEIRALIRGCDRETSRRRFSAQGPVAPAIPLSFSRYSLPRAEDDTQCLIEPAVRCNHCGYCECHGHRASLACDALEKLR